MKRAPWLLVITGVREDSKIAAVAGIRAARAVLGDRLGSTLPRAQETFREAEKSESTILGSHEERSVVEEARKRAVAASEEALQVEVQVNPENAPSDAGVTGEVRIYKVWIDAPTGEQVLGSESADIVAKSVERDAILVDDLGELSPVPFSWESIASALICMVPTNGNPSSATAFARTQALHDPGTWDEVVDVFDAVFGGSE